MIRIIFFIAGIATSSIVALDSPQELLAPWVLGRATPPQEFREPQALLPPHSEDTALQESREKHRVHAYISRTQKRLFYTALEEALKTYGFTYNLSSVTLPMKNLPAHSKSEGASHRANGNRIAAQRHRLKEKIVRETMHTDFYNLDATVKMHIIDTFRAQGIPRLDLIDPLPILKEVHPKATSRDGIHDDLFLTLLSEQLARYTSISLPPETKPTKGNMLIALVTAYHAQDDAVKTEITHALQAAGLKRADIHLATTPEQLRERFERRRAGKRRVRNTAS